MAPAQSVIGWLLHPADREALLAAIAPAYPRVVAHHVTLKFDAGPGEAASPVAAAAVVGVADDASGVQALVVEIDGETRRPDGSTYHITWSLAPNRRPVESNAVIAEHGWTPSPRFAIRLIAARF